jgi:uncharacterized cupredoxin-like copper-binding protein
MHRRIAVAAATAAVFALAACSSSGTSGASSAGGKTGTSSTPTKPAAPAPNTLSVTARESGSAMSYDISGSPHAGLVSIRFTNAGDDTHEMAVSMMKPGVTLDQLKSALKAKDGEQKAAALLENPDAEYPVPAALGPGDSEVATAKLTAGHYVVVCFFPGDDGMPHAMMGMIGEVTIAGGESSAQPPQAAGTVELTDHGITVPSAFGTGATYRVTNTGRKPHDFSLAKLAGKPLSALFQCVETAFGQSKSIDNCPGKLAGGVNTLQPGESAYLSTKLAPGQYGYISTEGDGADVKAGLAGTFTVK